MPSTGSSRLFFHLGVALVVVGGASLAGRYLAGAALTSAGLDWWNLPAILRSEADSERRVEKARVARDELVGFAYRRDLILEDVLSQRMTVPEGLDELRLLRDETPQFQKALRSMSHALAGEEALRVYYRRMLLQAVEQNPDTWVAFDPDFLALVQPGPQRLDRPAF